MDNKESTPELEDTKVKLDNEIIKLLKYMIEHGSVITRMNECGPGITSMTEIVCDELFEKTRNLAELLDRYICTYESVYPENVDKFCH